MKVYLDESGDLGWTFDAPFGSGGSSRYLTLAFLFLPPEKEHLTKRLIKSLYEKHKWDPGKEIKACDLNASQKEDFCHRVVRLIRANPDIRLSAITVKKEGVQPHIRLDPNKLYNYMIKLCVLKDFAKHPHVTLIHDERSVKVKSGNSMSDYLQTELWFTRNVQTKLTYIPARSDRNLNLLFIDYLVHCVWRSYERGEINFRQLLSPAIKCRQLYF